MVGAMKNSISRIQAASVLAEPVDEPAVLRNNTLPLFIVFYPYQSVHIDCFRKARRSLFSRLSSGL
jgi:hypothetical protein